MMDKNIPIIVLGSGGHAKVLIETLRENQIPIVGVTSLTLNKNDDFLGLKVIGNDGSGEANATNSYEMYIDVRNLPDYEGYDPTNKIPFFKDMWGAGSKFIDDAADQSIQIKGCEADTNSIKRTSKEYQGNMEQDQIEIKER